MIEPGNTAYESVRIWSYTGRIWCYAGPYFPAIGLNTGRYSYSFQIPKNTVQNNSEYRHTCHAVAFITKFYHSISAKISQYILLINYFDVNKIMLNTINRFMWNADTFDMQID